MSNTPAAAESGSAGRVLPLPTPQLIAGGVYTLVAQRVTGFGCPFHAATGLDCPFCGGTRALLSLLHGRFLQAIDHNALMTLSMVLAVPYVAVAVTRQPLANGAHDPKMVRYRLHVVVGVLLLWTLVRNLPEFAWFGSSVSQ